jgi:hypothetical protein
MASDPIETLAASHESDLATVLIAATDGYLDTIDMATLASALDDIDANHIRNQIAIILGLDDTGFPGDLDAPFADGFAALVTLAGAIAAFAASQARHALNPNGAAVRDGNTAAAAFLPAFRTSTADAIRTAIESAIYGVGSPSARAAQFRRAIGLSVKQATGLEIMREALQTYLDAPRVRIPPRTEARGNRVRATYVRNVNTRAIIAATRGHLSAGQTRMLTKALSNPNLTAADADAMLDRHAAALRHHRIQATLAEGIHTLAEQAKLTGWSIAQRFGALPADQRRHWRTAGDERVRHAHSQVPGMNPDGVPLDQPFETPFGPRMSAPLEMGCRCRASLSRRA